MRNRNATKHLTLSPGAVEQHERANEALRRAALEPTSAGGSVMQKREESTVVSSAIADDEMFQASLVLATDELDAISCVIENGVREIEKVERDLPRVSQKLDELRLELVDRLTASDPETDYSDFSFNEAARIWRQAHGYGDEEAD